MNKTIAASLLKLDIDDLYYEDIVAAEKKAVFDIKNFIFWNAYIPKLFEAKRKQLLKIENAVAVFTADNELEQKDEQLRISPEVNTAPEYEDFSLALQYLNLDENQSVAEFFASYETAAKRAKLIFSKTRSARYAGIALQKLIVVEQSFQVVFLHLFSRLNKERVELINREVKLKEGVLSSKLLEALTNLRLKDVALSRIDFAEVSGSDQEKKIIWTEWYRLAKIYDLPETKAAQ